jgi:UDP-GlcNAc:undecaprenyl-phosphate GlcNAc-1-phosphate transferase
VAIALAFAVVGILAVLGPIGATRTPASGLVPVLAGGGLIVLIGWIDDTRRLPPLVKLAGQIGAASVAYALGLRAGFLPDGPLDYLLTTFCLVGGSNALNLIDGLDGLAAGVAAAAAAVLFFVARNAGLIDAAVLAAILAGGAFAFLWFNLPPARAFLGDAGSNFLGFGLGALPLYLSGGFEGFEGFSAGVLLLSVPIVDTATSIGRRLLAGRSPLDGDLDHIHHRLLRRGWPLWTVLLLFHGTTGGLGLLVLFGEGFSFTAGERILVPWTALFMLLVLSTLFLLAPARLGPAGRATRGDAD